MCIEVAKCCPGGEYSLAVCTGKLAPIFSQHMVQRLSAMGQMPGQRPRRCDFEHQFIKVVLPLGWSWMITWMNTEHHETIKYCLKLKPLYCTIYYTYTCSMQLVKTETNFWTWTSITQSQSLQSLAKTVHSAQQHDFGHKPTLDECRSITVSRCTTFAWKLQRTWPQTSHG